MDELKSYIQAGNFAASDFVWREGMAEWVPAANIFPPAAKLVSAIAPSPPVIAAPKIAVTYPKRENAQGSEPNPNEVLWSGHPSLWHWAGKLIIFFLISLPLVVAYGAGLVLFGLVLGETLLVRHWTKYTVTRRIVSATHATLFSRTAQELRLTDIRSVAIHTNLFGMGSIECSTAGSADSVLKFSSIYAPLEVKELTDSLRT